MVTLNPLSTRYFYFIISTSFYWNFYFLHTCDLDLKYINPSQQYFPELSLSERTNKHDIVIDFAHLVAEPTRGRFRHFNLWISGEIEIFAHFSDFFCYQKWRFYVYWYILFLNSQSYDILKDTFNLKTFIMKKLFKINTSLIMQLLSKASGFRDINDLLRTM